MGLVEIHAAIKATLKTAATLKSVKKWEDAEPPSTKYPAKLFGWIEAAGGPETPMMDKMNVTDNFYIVLVMKSPDANANENTLLGLVDAVRVVLAANKTLTATVQDSYIINKEKQKVFQGDIDIVAWRLTLFTRRLLDA